MVARISTRALGQVGLVALAMICGAGLAAYCAEPQQSVSLQTAYSSFDRAQYEDALRLAKEVASGTGDRATITEAEELVIRSAHRAFGYDKAIEEAESIKAAVSQSRPDSSAELKSLDTIIAELTQQRADFQRLVGEQNQVIAKAPGTPEAATAALYIARQTLLSNGVSNGTAALRRLTSDYPKTEACLKAYTMLAKMQELAGDATSAKQTWVTAASQLSDTAFGEIAAHDLAELYLSAKAYQEGAEKFRALSASFPHSRLASASTLAIGGIAHASGDDKDAIAQYRIAVDACPESNSAVQAVDSMRQSFSALKDPEAAASEMNRLIGLYPNSGISARSQFCLGKIYREQSKVDLAEQSYLSAMGELPKSQTAVDAKTDLLDMCWEQALAICAGADKSLAESAARKVVKYEDRCEMIGESLCLLASILLGEQRYKDVNAILQPAVDGPSSALGKWQSSIEYYNAMAYYHQQDYKSALPALEKIVASSEPGEHRQAMESLVKQIESGAEEPVVSPQQ